MRRLRFAVLILIFVVGNSDVSESRITRGNYCSRLVRYNTITVNKTVTVYKTKHVLDCCPGYEKQNGVCIPICILGCNHGECVEPDVCLCKPGWKEPLCQTECEPNRFGRGCKGNCTCFHGAKCDQETGFCHCTEGYTGDQCQLPCPTHTYGQDCKYTCECENDVVCDNVDGTCYCSPGYKGEYCEKPCDNGTHGQDCGKDCICIPENTESCHHVDGKCTCKPGYRGEFCEKECDDFTYGPNCSKNCYCFHSEFCDHINGRCYCKPGWTGETCSEKCPIGRFGDNCSFECTLCLNISCGCDHVTGVCKCPPGRFGDFCDMECIPGYWGANCSNTCSCTESETCDPENGICSENNVFHSYTSTEYIYNYMVPLSIIGAIIALSLILLACCLEYDKRDPKFRIYSPSHVLQVIRRGRLNKNKCPISGATHNNPVYDEFNAVVLQSETNGSGFIRGSFSSGVKYVKNNVNNLDAENKLSNVEKSDDMAEGFKRNTSDTKDFSIRKSHVLSGVFKDMKRCSMRTDSTHSSTNELENDFQPEILDDFNIMENIYEKPTEKVVENIYDKPVVIDNKNLSVKEVAE